MASQSDSSIHKSGKGYNRSLTADIVRTTELHATDAVIDTLTSPASNFALTAPSITLTGTQAAPGSIVLNASNDAGSVDTVVGGLTITSATSLLGTSTQFTVGSDASIGTRVDVSSALGNASSVNLIQDNILQWSMSTIGSGGDLNFIGQFGLGAAGFNLFVGTNHFNILESGVPCCSIGSQGLEIGGGSIAGPHITTTQSAIPAAAFNGVSTAAVIDAGSTDISGGLTVTDGGAGAGGATVTFSVAYGSAPRVLVVARNAAAAAVTGLFVTSVAASFTLNYTAPGAAVPEFHYFVVA